MERGLLAPLSPNEELALRRIAGGRLRLAVRAGPDVERLKTLGLVEQTTNVLQLSELGKRRYAGLPYSAVGPDRENTARR